MSFDHVAEIAAQWAEQRPDLDASPLLIVGRINRLAVRLDGLLRPPFAARNLGNGDFDVLAALRRAGAPYQLRPVDLSRSLLVTTGAITKRLDRLQAQGLVEREATDSDGRGKITRLTPAGVALVDELIAVHLANEARLIGGLTTAERSQLQHLLARLSETLE
jgi:DNA-binding MarR family transcriptional regulator